MPIPNRGEHLHLAFRAENRQQVEAFYRAAMEAGGKDNGAPGLLLNITPMTHQLSSLVRTDNIEAVCHEPEA